MVAMPLHMHLLIAAGTNTEGHRPVGNTMAGFLVQGTLLHSIADSSTFLQTR
jgi:hypothetical protein